MPPTPADGRMENILLKLLSEILCHRISDVLELGLSVFICGLHLIAGHGDKKIPGLTLHDAISKSGRFSIASAARSADFEARTT